MKPANQLNADGGADTGAQPTTTGAGNENSGNADGSDDLSNDEAGADGLRQVSKRRSKNDN